MKRVLIGGFLSFIGTIWGLPIIIFAGNNVVCSWITPPGRFFTTIIETGMFIPFIVAMIVFGGGLIIMGIEYFKKDN